MRIRYRRNGSVRVAEVDPTTPASTVIFDEDRHSEMCRWGCSLRCCALVGGRVCMTCTIPAFRIEGANVLTPAGLADNGAWQDIERAFEKVGIDRCVESVPIMEMLALQLLLERRDPTDEAIQRLSRYVVTRCCSREEFERAVRLASRLYSRRDGVTRGRR